MSRQVIDRDRRRFMTAVIAAPIVEIAGVSAARAADMPHLSLDDPQAKGLGYVHDAAKAEDNPAYQEGAHCANCLQWTGGDAQWGGCKIFPGKAVNRSGWCTVWVKKG